MRTIVTPTDFSAISMNAVNYAADLACVIGTSVSMLHVCAIPIPINEVPVPAYSTEALVNSAKEKLQLLKEKIIDRTGGRIKITVEVKQGDVVSELVAYCSSMNTYAVIMGTESAGAFERFFLGGTTISALRKLLLPLIVVPPNVKFASLQKIGLACDLKKVPETIPFTEIKSLVKDFHAELHILHVSTKSGNSSCAETFQESGLLQDILGEFNPVYHFVNDTDIEKGINEFVERNKLDLLIIIPKRNNLIHNIFHHSHSKRLVLHTHVPVMAIHE